ncbi:hypothetical protein KSS87_008489 [Heliosperma pusillum]|nr:hypothetical protein KSS87_008489 [Heliosperma pusillum]
MSSRLLNRRTRHHLLTITRHHATLTGTGTGSLMPYDRISDSVKSKLSRLNNPDPRFLRRASPQPTSSDEIHLLQFPDTKVTVLPNGLRVASESTLSSHTASVSVIVDSGSRFDPDHLSGVASFFHHLILGSVPLHSADVAAHLSGFVHRETTTLSARLLGDNLHQGIHLLASLFQDLDLTHNIISNIRHAILEQKEQVKADGEDVILDHLHATAFQYTPLGRTVYGPANNIHSITAQDIQNYILSHCAAHRMVISASGAVKHEELVEQVKKVFTKLSANPTTTSQLIASDPVNFTGSEVRIIDDDLPLARFAVAFEGTSSKDPDSIALLVMQTMLGSWSKIDGAGNHVGSQLVQRVAINEIAETIKTFNINYKDTGLFGIYAVAKPDCLDDLSYGIMHEISKLSYRVSKDDVIRARNQLKSHLILHSNEFGAVSEEIGRQLLSYGRRIPFAELFARIDAVDASTVKRVANRFLFDKDIAIAAMGPIKGLPDYNWFRRRTYWLRY